MKFREVKSTKKDFRVFAHVSDIEVPEGAPFSQEVLNVWVFKSIATAKKYYKDMIEHNKNVIKDNESRMSGMPEGVEHLSEFVTELKKKKTIGKKLSKDMDKVIRVWEARAGFVSNIEKTKEKIEHAKEVLRAIK